MNPSSASSELLYFIERGSGPPLLLVHGLMATSEMFAPVIEHFATRHRVVVPDLRGHGLIFTHSAELTRVTDEFLRP